MLAGTTGTDNRPFFLALLAEHGWAATNHQVAVHFKYNPPASYLHWMYGPIMDWQMLGYVSDDSAGR
jgi:hypothetical protein